MGVGKGVHLWGRLCGNEATLMYSAPHPATMAPSDHRNSCSMDKMRGTANRTKDSHGTPTASNVCKRNCAD